MVDRRDHVFMTFYLHDFGPFQFFSSNTNPQRDLFFKDLGIYFFLLFTIKALVRLFLRVLYPLQGLPQGVTG